MSVADVRAFNRFYTGVIGLLDDAYLDSPYSLTEVRVLLELVAGTTDVKAALGVDAGYLSRILGRFERDGLITRSPSPDDARRHVVTVTGHGRQVFADLDTRSDAAIGALLDRVPASDRTALVAAMARIRRILTDTPRSYLLRPLRPGDLGWVVHRHGVRYAEEYAYDDNFEALVARVVADYVLDHDPTREAAWIAEVDGEPVGSIFCVRGDAETARLRLLLVEPQARGLGIGKRLVEECVRFATRVGYRRMTLATVSEVEVARGIYRRAGFEPVRSEPVRKWGKDVVEETWALDL
ncbi:bifunctional helix-turn-helix transcriptional regulator/GNAT family N-acetyltransferase [Actinosynnema sp. NPDC047251]|uniref:Transcriptional regulator, MarR family n=1 Tax=Saccharothrix espanaensis (strain ATCC 51144 / DSM 44229 / JCM 9112 / NBRC 15066 / NRRL 15764) TaxID=1179773 RepID=K0K1P4_SACES|nr:bifunctional helix-turn-helix transcriptional regulator/GNAT family N-acetyltransferase [Saccharothrix espanaensis]CCH30493.1 Transcriptional regulator, MarR family [Saccharothrix espanaensis DSM 44229]